MNPGGGCFGADEIRDFLSFATANYDVDPNRIYLTGLSCGAIGLWKEVKMTIYPGVGHNSWSKTYDLSAGHDIYTWMMSKQR